MAATQGGSGGQGKPVKIKRNLASGPNRAAFHDAKRTKREAKMGLKRPGHTKPKAR
jgi:hypothetical protein